MSDPMDLIASMPSSAGTRTPISHRPLSLSADSLAQHCELLG